MMKTSRWVVLGLATWGVSSFASPAQAADEWRPVATQPRVGVDVHVWSADFSGTSMPIVPFLQLDLTETVFLDIQLPFTMLLGPFDDKTRASVGNFQFGAHYADELAEDLTLVLGGKLGAPFGANDDDDYQLASVGAAAAYAAYDSPLWVLDTLPLWLTVGAEYQALDNVYLRANFDPIFLIPLGTGGGFLRGPRDFQFGTQQKLEGEVKTESGFGGGLAMQFVEQWTGSASDKAQLSMEPFGAYDSESLFARLGFLIALDSPLGFGFDSGKVFSLHLGVGGHLD